MHFDSNFHGYCITGLRQKNWSLVSRSVWESGKTKNNQVHLTPSSKEVYLVGSFDTNKYYSHYTISTIPSTTDDFRLCQFEIDICLSIYLGMFTMALYIMIFDFPFFFGFPRSSATQCQPQTNRSSSQTWSRGRRKRRRSESEWVSPFRVAIVFFPVVTGLGKRLMAWST